MIRVTGRYLKQKVELDRPLDIADGTEVEILICPEKEGWSQIGMERLEQEWDNPEDSIYDEWKKHYGL